MLFFGVILLGLAIFGGVGIVLTPLDCGTSDVMAAMTIRWAVAVVVGLLLVAGSVLIGAGSICAEIAETRRRMFPRSQEPDIGSDQY